MRTPLLALIVAPLLSSSALAIGPGQAERGFVEGANHHLGDLSFFARFGREPGPDDSEKLRMHTHLAFVREWLASRPATRPELAARRAELLGYLDDYIARDITPHNNNLPYRNPVFVDEQGRICAVGYLIEQSGRSDIVDAVVAHERFDVLDDIDLPAMAEWVAASGFTRDELASLQPGYMAPMIEQWGTWSIAAHEPSDGPWSITVEQVQTRGTWKRGQMEGAWTRTDAAGRVIGRGDFKAGKGVWTSFDEHGKTIASGPFVASHPHGAWQFFHPSGNVAARGRFTRGGREGKWEFFYDTAEPTLIAAGRFRGQRVTGTWKHFGPDGALVGETSSSPANQYEDLHTLRTPAGADGISRSVTAGNSAGDSTELWAWKLGKTTLFHETVQQTWYDVEGYELTRLDSGAWFKNGCGWSPSLRRAAKTGDSLRTAKRLTDRGSEEPASGLACVAAMPVAPELAATYNSLVTRATTVATPSFVKAIVEARACEDCEPDVAPADLVDVVGGNMGWYIEWPHIDGLFARVFETLADHYAPDSVPITDQFTEQPDTSLGLVFN